MNLSSKLLSVLFAGVMAAVPFSVNAEYESGMSENGFSDSGDIGFDGHRYDKDMIGNDHNKRAVKHYFDYRVGEECQHHPRPSEC